MIANFLEQAATLGLQNRHRAKDYWTLSATGELQVEEVWIAWTPAKLAETKVRELAQEIKQTANQDAVAYELGGIVYQLRD